MQKLLIKSRKNLFGKISISGSKNASLPILAASILSKKVTIKNIPLVKDVYTMIELLSFIGLNINNIKRKLNTVAPYKLVKTMRAGILVLGPLLAKYKSAKVSLPGGCAIGTRPVDLHLFALKKLGAKIKIINGYIYASAKNGLTGNKIKFSKISVGATENAIIAASQAKGTTSLYNCATEPEVQDLILFLKKLGCRIKTKNRKIVIEGNFEPRKISLTNLNSSVIKTEIKTLQKMGVKMKISKDKIIITKAAKIKSINISTAAYPGFPTDLQAQIMVLMTKANGVSKIKENIFENRFMHVPELKRMGAKISIKNNIAKINGPTKLSGAEVMATDLRASVSLVLAGLIANNQTIINRIYHLDRGYENLENKLKKCKAIIRRI